MGAFDDLIPASGGGRFDDLVPTKQADPKIGQPEDLSFAEKYLAPAFEQMAARYGISPGAAAGTKGNLAGRLLKGASDPAVAAAQVAANVLPGDTGKSVNTWVADQERQYQDARQQAGSEGFDPARAIGSVVATAPAGLIGTTGMLAGGAVGGALGALEPVTNGGDNFWWDKLKQTGIGTAGGAVLSPVMGGLARLVSPKASTDAGLKLLRDEGVNPTIGQALGGVANVTEQKLTSLPILGDMIASARRGAIEDFNTAATNRAVAPIGGSVSGAGHEAVADAGDALSAVYNQAAKDVHHVNLDTPQFNADFGQLQQMAGSGLAPDLAKRFDNIVNDTVLRRLSPNGSIAGTDLKAVDSELGTIARRYGKSSVASEQDFGDAVKQLRSIVQQEVARANPGVAQALKNADTGWANLVRVEGAAKAAANNEGVFTPAQLMASIKANAGGVRGRDVSRGDALMQDLADAGQRLGTKVPDSGSIGRAAMSIGALASGALHPGVPLALGAGAVAYTKPIQNFLVKLAANRPKEAPAVANYLRRLQIPLTVGGAGLVEEQRR